jgi:hypothetical protein
MALRGRSDTRPTSLCNAQNSGLTATGKPTSSNASRITARQMSRACSSIVNGKCWDRTQRGPFTQRGPLVGTWPAGPLVTSTATSAVRFKIEKHTE